MKNEKSKLYYYLSISYEVNETGEIWNVHIKRYPNICSIINRALAVTSTPGGNRAFEGL